MPLSPGQLVAGKYCVERLLAEGGMGAVYIAENRVLQKRVAIKVMSEGFSAIPGATERFLREGIAASRVSHPAIVQVFDAGEHEGAPWLAMELLEGMSLGERVETRGPLPLLELMHVCRGVLPALAAVHEQGLIHRDLKPDNIFLATIAGGGFQPKLLDFGVAKDTRGGVNKLTATGAVVGTASYLAPEQARGAEIDARTDIYAMGAVIYEALSGRLPYEADTLTQLVAKMFTESPVPLEQVSPTTPPAICAVVSHCLAQNPAQRFAGATELLAALEAASSHGVVPVAASAGMAYDSTAIGALPEASPGVPSMSSMSSMSGMPPMSAHGLPSEVLATGVATPRKRSAVPILAGAFVLGAICVAGVLYVLNEHSSSSATASADPEAPTTAAPPATGAAADPNALPSGAAIPEATPAPGGEPTPDQAAAPAASHDSPAAGHRTPGHRAGAANEVAEPATEPSAPSAPSAPSTPTTPAAPDPLAPAAPTAPLPPGVHSAPLPPGFQAAPVAPGVVPRPATPPTPPTPTPSAAASGLTPAQLAPVVNEVMPRMQRCFDRRVRRVRGLAGAITVQFVIDASGRVTQSDAVTNGTGDEWMGRCVAQNVQRMRFPAAANGRPTRARRIFHFGGG